MAASIGLAVPADSAKYGYISEHHAFGQSEKVAGDYAEDLAASMLATVLGISFRSGGGLGRTSRAMAYVGSCSDITEPHGRFRGA